MGILEYRTMRSGVRGDDPETDFGMIGHGVTGSDIACRTSDCYVNSGVGHWMTDGVPGHLVLNWKGGTDTLGRKGTDTLGGLIGQLGRKAGKRQAP